MQVREKFLQIHKTHVLIFQTKHAGKFQAQHEHNRRVRFTRHGSIIGMSVLHTFLSFRGEKRGCFDLSNKNVENRCILQHINRMSEREAIFEHMHCPTSQILSSLWSMENIVHGVGWEGPKCCPL